MVFGWVCGFVVRLKGVAVRLACGLGVAENLLARVALNNGVAQMASGVGRAWRAVWAWVKN